MAPKKVLRVAHVYTPSYKEIPLSNRAGGGLGDVGGHSITFDSKTCGST